MPDMKRLSPKAAFFHVIDPHRWLAASGCAWNLVGAKAANETKEQADRLLPNIGVMIRDCLLLHARSLIKFYLDRKKNETDIALSDFGVSVVQPIRKQLEKYENPIEVHLLHLTDWRDYGFRTQYATGTNAKKDRPDWDEEVTIVVESILEKALKTTSEQGTTGWPVAFKRLYDASTARYRNKSYDWPPELGEKPDVEEFLGSIGL
jgi:hypothetical protein